MGATSVTGTSGAGSCDGKNKGSEHMSLGVHHLIGSHVSAAGSITLSTGTGTVELPARVGALTDYFVMLTSNTSATAPYVSTGLTLNASGAWTFVITGGTSDVVNWMVVKTGL